ncbi:MAG: succinylglutamate desuccinylase/aspartoacylase family protein [Proteobacteria bacterium]|nr:succinylglutamate desuccinylase/aspartoacylase family protein [Pseudomonadota bacterium]MBI3495985.1 succinylglutamate desuccinylase/aspartoacylase family protein [Pseudomonadota bacterium]
MAYAKSRIWTELDFEKDGKQVGYLHLPHSVTRSAYGTIAIPCAVIRNGAGPSTLLMAGNHGDEYEGQVALGRIIRELHAEDIKGRIIVVPAINLPAAMAGTRVSPVDDRNLNRSFPGNPNGTPTEQIAYYIEAVLAAMCESWLDLHSGGGSLAYVPFASTHLTQDAKLNKRALAALKAFGSPISVIQAFSDEPNMANSAATRNKAIYFGTEAGGTGNVNPDGVKLAYEGTLRALAHFGHLSRRNKRLPIPPAPKKLRWVEIASRDYYVYAPQAGLFEPKVKLGRMVKKDQLYGQVHFVDDPLRPPAEVRFKISGLLVCTRHPGRCERGDCLAHLATDIRR